MDLKLDSEELNTCVHCGLCLPHCPTFRITGEEALSPRGRIRLMQEIQTNDQMVTKEALASFETCIQCRGCEPACPSGVPYGSLIEQTRKTLVQENRILPRWQRIPYHVLTRPRLLRFLSRLLTIANKVHLIPKRFAIPKNIPFFNKPLIPSGTDVYLFTGCVMDAWQRETHQAGKRVLEHLGFGVTPTGDRVPCCGALHTHAGLGTKAQEIAENVINSLSDNERPILVDSAGCGAALKDYGHLLGTEEALAFSSRIFDIHEWVEKHIETFAVSSKLSLRVAIQDPCHLRHVQRSHRAVRNVLEPFVDEVIELNDDGLCCGAGGAFSIFQPDLASKARDQKIAVINEKQCDVVASANPGCSMHLQQGGIDIRHPMDIIDEAISLKTIPSDL
ncbi:MAG: (Fe-S)-binding protein [Acidimicrobiales bacterium]|nr:(Fe-S)-binding protein [Acidimicrobiales bacterium]MDG1846217.1 (Fe-S)-binding protein [Acidimicrobiales bacterium]